MGHPGNRLAPQASTGPAVNLRRVRRLVVKVGSGLIASPRTGLAPERIELLVDQVASLKAKGLEVVLVSSGAIVAGIARLGMGRHPHSIPEKQAAAAVGQSALMWLYERAFGTHNHKVAQVLLTQDDLSHRHRYLNARNTLLTLLRYGVVPVVNENDTVAVDEIKVGDNDNLSALVAHLVDAGLLVLLSDIDGLYTADPRHDPGAKLIKVVEAVTPELEGQAGQANVGIGGMVTKLQAAQKATGSGIPMVIANGQRPGVLEAILRGEPVGTIFLPKGDRLAARKRWIAFALAPQGFLRVDVGAHQALTAKGKSLLPSGIVEVKGEFGAGEVVGVLDPDGVEFARGLVHYEAGEIRRILGAKTADIENILGYKYLDEVIHRDNLVLL